MSTENPVLLTPEELEKEGRKLERELRLTGWAIRYELLPHSEMPDGVLGRVEWFYREMAALVKIADPASLNLDTAEPYDWRQVLTHELLHIVLLGISRPWEGEAEEYMPPKVYRICQQVSEDAEEQAIQILSRLISDLRQAQQEAPTS